MIRHHAEERWLPYSAAQMFDLVADVKRYPEFLPWVVAIRVREESDAHKLADMVVGFRGLRERFTSRVVLERPERLSVEYVDGPLAELTNRWSFVDEDGGCRVGFEVGFRFRNRLFQTLAGQMFDRALRAMIGAFETRAAALYGASASVRSSTSPG